MQLTFIFYIFAAFIVIPGTFFILAMFNKFLAAGIASLGMLVLFILFGLQFFTVDGNYVQQTTPINWPPSVNYCPDYLSLLKISDGSFVCVDTVGVANGGSSTLQYYNPNNSVTGTPTPNESQKFNLHLDISDDTQRTSAIVNDCKTKGLTFEGIYDGLKTYNNTVPRIPNA